MISRAFALSLTLAAAACSAPAPEKAAAIPPTVQAADALCWPTAPGRRRTLCFVTLTAATDDALVSAATPLAARAALHDVPMENEMLVMLDRTEPVPLPAGQAVRLAPKGQAIALQGIRAPLVAGQTAPLTLTFASSSPVQIVARVADEPAA